MKRFIIKTIVFIFFLFCYFGISCLINLYLYTHQVVHIPNKKILIVGDSHPQRSLNPIYFRSAENISQSAEPYVLTYWKLKRIFQYYNPDTLILGFAPHNISQYNDLKFSNNEWASEMFRRSYPIGQYSDIENSMPVDYVTFYKTLIKQIAFFPKKNHINYIGNYSNSAESNISDWKHATKRHYYFNNKKLGISKVATTYLDSIVNQCLMRNISLVLVSNPVHKNYFDNIPSSIIQEYENLKNKYAKKFLVIDKTQDFYPDSLFLNSDHLNDSGAIKFTREIIDELN